MTNQASMFIFKDVKQKCAHKFDSITQLPNIFFFNELNTKPLNGLSMIVQLVVTLSHGQATIKREFSENQPILEKSMGQESLILHKYIKDYMHANNHKPYDVKLTEPMILLVKSERKNKNSI